MEAIGHSVSFLQLLFTKSGMGKLVKLRTKESVLEPQGDQSSSSSRHTIDSSLQSAEDALLRRILDEEIATLRSDRFFAKRNVLKKVGPLKSLEKALGLLLICASAGKKERSWVDVSNQLK